MNPRSFVFALGLLGAACSSSSTAPRAVPSATGGDVTFVVSAPQDRFLSTAEVTITVWDKEQLALYDAMGACSVAFDGTRETITCLDGKAPPPKPTPETMTVKVTELGKPVVFVSKTVQVGEPYRVDIGGPAPDKCNRTSGSASGTSSASTLTLDTIGYGTTEKGCPRE